ncbi:MAG TPA: DAK2 domain-containing protein, partial [Mycobacteriales bacterium]|nr:DAK2 domain-containing protein [Mycobacteriales bacterium]
ARAAIAAASRRPPDAATVARAAAEAAADALARTPLQLAALARAGVVDAGGRGLVVLLEALVAVLAGEPVELARAQVLARGRSGIVATREAGSETFGYEVQYLLDAPDAEIPSLRAALGALGDCLVIVGGEGLWNVHVHVNVVGAAIEAGIEAGRPHRISVTRFADQIEAGSLPGEAPGRRRSVVAVVPGGGLTALFSTAGACVLAGGPTANPSTQEVLDAIIGSAATEVVVLPNDATVRGVAEAAAIVARDEGLVVAVVPTKSPVQGLAALAVHDPDRRFSDDVIAMTAAAGATRWAEVTIAVREAQTSAGVCRPGDVLGLVEGDVTLMGSQIREVACGLLDRLLDGGGELVTLVTGADADEDLGAVLCEYLGRTRPAVETVVYSGGQPHYPLLVGVE